MLALDGAQHSLADLSGVSSVSTGMAYNKISHATFFSPVLPVVAFGEDLSPLSGEVLKESVQKFKD